MTREFIRMPNFESCWNNCGLTEDAIIDLEISLCSNPQIGVPIKGTGGLRKVRWALPNSGKRGGIRIIYVDFVVYEKIYLISAYIKGEKDTLTDNEKKVIKKLIKELETELRKK